MHEIGMFNNTTMSTRLYENDSIYSNVQNSFL